MQYHPIPLPLLPGSNTIAVEIKYEKQFTTVDDVWHDEDHLHDFYEIYINLTGDVSFRVGEQVYPIEGGDMILTTPNELHRCLYHSDCVHEHFCIWIKGVPLSNEAIASRFTKQTRIALSDANKEKLLEHCFGLYQSMQKENELQFRAAHHFFGILDLICTGKQTGNDAQILPIRFTEILLYISRHFSDPSCNVTQVCEQFFISKSSLRRLFSNYFQTTPSQYIESYRFAEAKKLLMTGHSAQYTCFHCGFSDCSYFVMRFRKKFGVTPAQYRKQNAMNVASISD